MARAFPPDKAALLADNSLLRHLDPADRARLAGYAQHVHHAAETVIFQRGDSGDAMMAVARGRVKICCHSSEGKELILNIIRPGEVFGEIALIDGEPRTADAVALEVCDLLVLYRRDFLAFLDGHPRVAERLLWVLCQRLRRTSAQLEDTLFCDVPARLARCLLHLAQAFARPTPTGICINIKLSQQQLGAIAGITRESVNKQLGLWQKAGWIAMTRGYITVIEAPSLAAMADWAEGQPTPCPTVNQGSDKPPPARPCP